MLTIENLTIKNFMSCGAVTQSVRFNDDDFVLILGENLDQGGNDARNGCGKSTILNALSYAIYGNALTKIKKPNLINKTNGKAMLVTLDFTVNGVKYHIERGRKPEVLQFTIDGDPLTEKDDNEAQGDSRNTQDEIERIVGFSFNMFQNIVTLTTNGLPFLGSTAAQQREVIEHLLGITKLSEKAEKLKVIVKATKDSIKHEKIKHDAIEEANRRMEISIKSMETKCTAFETKKQASITKTKEAIQTLGTLDVQAELDAHSSNNTTKIIQDQADVINRDIASLNRELTTLTKTLTDTEKNVSISSDNECPTCGQNMDDETHRRLHDEYKKQIDDTKKKIDQKQGEKKKLSEELLRIGTIPDRLDTFYGSIEDAYNHKSTLDGLLDKLDKETDSVNPFTDEIESLKKNGIQDIDYTLINKYTTELEHQEFLLKLLTNKDSFIRKKIVNQNLVYLNAQLDHYLVKIGLPHTVIFNPDLTVDITEHGRDLDFDNLSRGEKTRLMLSLSWAFRDVYEQLNHPINALFVDELLDNGLDTNGVESAVSIMKEMARHGKNIFLISHREELIGRIDKTLMVQKEGGFTRFVSDND